MHPKETPNKRVRPATGFITVSGDTVSDEATLERIKLLGLPPAYKDVWICADAQGHLQATGRDERGRKQYRYHTRWSRQRVLSARR